MAKMSPWDMDRRYGLTGRTPEEIDAAEEQTMEGLRRFNTGRSGNGSGTRDEIADKTMNRQNLRRLKNDLTERLRDTSEAGSAGSRAERIGMAATDERAERIGTAKTEEKRTAGRAAAATARQTKNMMGYLRNASRFLGRGDG